MTIKYLDSDTYVKRAQRLLDEGYPRKVHDYRSGWDSNRDSVPLSLTVSVDADISEVQATLAQVKEDCAVVERALRDLADGDLDAFRGERAALVSEATARLWNTCREFHRAPVAKIASDIAKYHRQ